MAQRLGCNHRRELDHQPGSGVQIAVTEHLVEGEVVEGLDELGVGHRQGGDVPRKSSSWFLRAWLLGAIVGAIMGAIAVLLVVALHS
jgi:hypothetical protein